MAREQLAFDEIGTPQNGAGVEDSISINRGSFRGGGLLGNLRPIQGIVAPKPNTIAENQKPQPTLAKPEVEDVVVSDSQEETPQSIVLGASTLPYVQNPYPVEIGTDPSPNYSLKDSTITYSGKFPQNFLTFKLESIDDIKALDINEYPTSFGFIVEFIDNDVREYWSSPVLLGQIQAEINSANPYKTRKKYPILQFDFKFIKGYSTQEQFKIPEDYAEVNVTKTLTTKEDVLKHLDWLISSDETLRRAGDMGAWEINLTENLGMQHSKALDSLNSRILNEESNISDNLGGDDSDAGNDGDNAGSSSSLGGSNSGGSTNDDNQLPDSNSSLLYPPFGEKGRRKNEIRTKGGTRYRWSKLRQVWIQLT